MTSRFFDFIWRETAERNGIPRSWWFCMFSLDVYPCWEMTMKKALALLLAAGGPVLTFALIAPQPTSIRTSTTSLNAGGPFDKIFDRDGYEQTVQNLMATKGLTYEEAKQDYDTYLENPTNYALNKGEAYYKNLGYKSLMDGVVGEAEKQGRGEEVRARIEAFKRKSQLKGMAVITTFIALGFWAKLNDDPSNYMR